MDSHTNVVQPEEYLELLLDHLACPMEHTVPLIAVRDSAGRVTSLRARDREYAVVHNVPRLIPKLKAQEDSGYTLWEELQGNWAREYGRPATEEPSPEDEPIAGTVGQVIARGPGGLFLDVGCGTSPLPAYMVTSGEGVTWFGLDPLLGNTARRFPFVQGLGEYLPFRPETFDGMLYALVLNNLMDPWQSLRRGRSLLKPDGWLYIWYYLARVDWPYIRWRAARALGLGRRYNEYYQWVFTHRAVRGLLRKTGFAIEERIPLCRACPHYEKCEEPDSEFLIVARRA
jgi:SAM-dependent methyltransferase